MTGRITLGLCSLSRLKSLYLHYITQNLQTTIKMRQLYSVPVKCIEFYVYKSQILYESILDRNIFEVAT